jgi:hypothetical protein
MNLIPNHSAYLEIAAFDLLIGALLLRYCRKVPVEARARFVLGSTGVIGGLVNLGGWFYSAGIVEMLVIYGGLPLVLLLLPGEEGKRDGSTAWPSPQPKPASGLRR